MKECGAAPGRAAYRGGGLERNPAGVKRGSDRLRDEPESWSDVRPDSDGSDVALAVIGVEPDGWLEKGAHSVERCTGVALGPEALCVASRHQIWRFSDSLSPTETAACCACAFRPRVCFDMVEFGLLVDDASNGLSVDAALASIVWWR
jgi:hypothetical protein